MDNTREKSQKKKRSIWSIEAEELLLVLWAQNFTKLQQKNKFYILSKMSTKMEDMGYPFTAYEIRVKIHNLKNRYRAERRRITDGFPSQWPIYDTIHRILDGHHANQKEIRNNGTHNSARDLGDNNAHQHNPSEDQYDDDINCDDYPNEDSYDNNADETAATSMSESKDSTNKSDEKMYLKSINRNLVLLLEKMNELSEQTRLMENERNNSLNKLLDVIKYHTRGKPRHNSTCTQERHVAKKRKLSEIEDMGATTRENQEHDIETFSHYIEEDDPLCNESDMKSVNEDDKHDENIDEDLTSPIKKSPPSLQSNKIMLEKKLKEEYLKTKQLERDFMTEKHKLQMEILNVELEAKKKIVLN